MKHIKKSDNKMLFGVCSGLADYSGIDPTIIRLLFIFGSIFTGSILFWIYLLLAVLMPSE